jgi:sigma-B regulation protein RsbU (phosphoserine phosphatase)
VVADVSDKGTAAALFMALSRTLIRTYAPEYETQPDLIFRTCHRRILTDTDTRQFVTVFCGVLDPASGTLTYANAGHNPPYLFRARNGGEVRELNNTGPPLGLRMFPDMIWECRQVQIEPGDVLLLYSDGVTEAQDVSQEFFEEERLIEAAQASLGCSASEIQSGILTKVHQFMGSAPQADDITVFVLVRDSTPYPLSHT